MTGIARFARWAFPVLAGLLAAPVALAAANPLQAMSGAFEELASRVSPAVVEVLVTGYGEDGDSPDGAGVVRRGSSQGSGVIVDADGYIITNHHVIAGQQEVSVIIVPQTRRGSQADAALSRRPRIVPARVVGSSEQADLAVLKVDARGLPTIPFARYRQLRQGQLVMAVGSPVGLQNSVSLGIVSAVLRQVDPESPMVHIQTDAAINPGNSGGALVDVDGNLVGINSSIFTRSGGSEGIGFAIPGAIAEFLYRQIREHGQVRTGYIGADIQALTPALVSALDLPGSALPGVIVADVHPGSPAEEAGLRIYDRIVAIDGAPVDSVPTFVMNVFLRKKGDSVRLGVARGEDEFAFAVPVIEVGPGPSRFSDLADPGTHMIPRLGVIGVELGPEIASFLPPARIDSGVVVTAISADEGNDAGLRQGDIIHALNGEPVTTLDGLRLGLRSLPIGAPAVLQVERGGRLLLLSFCG
ncbi:MAG: trypsin-like peptidase domain-containing protein [Xanthomonadales bacterium]|nr:trypsin-like peptidase domain-containing protein [Xanthomonadales bacterium]